MFLRTLILLMLLALPAVAQQVQKPDPELIQLQLDETRFMLDARRADLLKAGKVAEDAASRLKWVLDNWVPKK